MLEQLRWRKKKESSENSEKKKVSLLHADVELHLVEPLPSMAGGVAESNVARLNGGEELNGAVVTGGCFVYFSVVVKSEEVVCVNVKPRTGDLDLFASSTVRFPSSVDFEICSVDGIGEKELKLRGGRDGTSVEYVVGVVSEQAVEFVARVASAVPHGVAPAHSNNDDAEMCSNCRKAIPKASLQLHSVRCKQLVFFCEPCHFAIPSSAKNKHEMVMHGNVVCGCGASMERREIPNHKRDGKCPLSLSIW